MKVITVLASLISAVLANSISIPTIEDDLGIQQIITKTASGEFSIENLTGPIPDYQAKEEDVKFFFGSRDTMNRIQVDARDPNSIDKTSFSPHKDTWFIVHGWQNDFSSDVGELVGNSILKKADANIFCVDWSSIAKKTYVQAFAAVPEVGRITGELIKVLMEHHGLQLDRVHLVGHSLGAHVAGRIGADLDGKVPLIVGLDPAGPLFIYEIKNNRLDPSDAQHVHVIHTCSAILGFRRPIGHADFYPNGGEFQPFCQFDITGSCSHSQSYIFYAESIISGKFVAKVCSSKEDFVHGKCNNNIASEMGGYSPNRGASGTYYLETNNEPPYARG